MTGAFITAVRTAPCVISTCRTVIHTGAWVYLWRGIDRQTVCPACALTRWGYQPPSDAPPAVPTPVVSKPSGFVPVGKITPKELEQFNASDPKLKAAGDR